MIKEAIGIGASLKEAQEDAVAQLNARDDDDIQFEVLEEPHKKAFGLFGSVPAKVRAYIEIPDAKENKKPAPKKAAKPQKQEKPAKVEEKQAKAENKEKIDPDTGNWPEPVTVDKLEPGSKAEKAVKYLAELLDNLGCTNVELLTSVRENGAKVLISGDGMGVAIGRKGETLDALQHLTSLSANAGKGGYFKVFLNIGDYRQKREQTLIALAGKVAAQVKRTGRNRTLEPMNPYERRIIHTAIQEIEGVTSGSVGEGSGRKVVVSLEKGARNNFKQNAKPESNAEPKKDADIPLYGQIN